MVITSSGTTYGKTNWFIPADEFGWAYDRIAATPEPSTVGILMLGVPLLARRKAA